MGFTLRLPTSKRWFSNTRPVAAVIEGVMVIFHSLVTCDIIVRLYNHMLASYCYRHHHHISPSYHHHHSPITTIIRIANITTTSSSPSPHHHYHLITAITIISASSDHLCDLWFLAVVDELHYLCGPARRQHTRVCPYVQHHFEIAPHRFGAVDQRV